MLEKAQQNKEDKGGQDLQRVGVDKHWNVRGEKNAGALIVVRKGGHEGSHFHLDVTGVCANRLSSVRVVGHRAVGSVCVGGGDFMWLDEYALSTAQIEKCE